MIYDRDNVEYSRCLSTQTAKSPLQIRRGHGDQLFLDCQSPYWEAKVHTRMSMRTR